MGESPQQQNVQDMQAELIVKLARGMRLSWVELKKEIPNVDEALAALDEHYIGGKGCIAKAIKTRPRGR